MRWAFVVATVCGLAAFPVAANAGDAGFDFSFTASGTAGTPIPNRGIGLFPLDMVGADGLPNAIPGGPGAAPFSIASIELEIKGLTHQTPADLLAFLIDPFGRNTVVMDNQGGQFAVSGVNLVFKDGAANPLPVNGQIASGTFLPTLGDFHQFTNSGTDAWVLVIINANRDNQGSGSPASFDSFTLRGTVPEPVTLSLLAIGALVTLRRPRR